MAAPLRVNRLSIGGTAQGQGVGGLTPLQPVQALGPIKGGPPLFSIHSGNEPFQARRTTFPVNHVAGAEMSSPGSELRTPRSVFNKTVLVAPSEPPPPVARTMHANHPRSKVKRRNTFSKNSKVLKEGVLMKMKVMDRLHEGEKAWHKRHFQIRDGFFLWFPAKGPRKKPSGWVRVRDVMAVRVCDAAMGLPGVDSESVARSFQVTTTARALYLRARTIEDMQEWMKMLVSSKCLTPAVHKSFAFPDIAAGPVAGDLLPKLSDAVDLDGVSESEEVPLRPKRLSRKHSSASKHSKHHKHRKHHKRKKHRSSRSRSPALPPGGAPPKDARRRSQRSTDSNPSKTSEHHKGDAVASPKARRGSEELGGGDEAGSGSHSGRDRQRHKHRSRERRRSSENHKEGDVGDGESKGGPRTPQRRDGGASGAGAGRGGGVAFNAAGAGAKAMGAPASATSTKDWEAHWDSENKRTVYVNKVTQETTTELPEFTDITDGKWVKCFDYDSQREYYFHTSEGTTQFEKPDGYVEDPDEAAQPGWGWGGWDGTLKKSPAPTPKAVPPSEGKQAVEGKQADEGDSKAGAVAGPDGVVHWIECWDENYHCPYYVNMESNVSVWEMPTGDNVRITQYVDEDGDAPAVVEEEVVSVASDDEAGAGIARPPRVSNATDASAPEEIVDDIDIDDDAF